MNDEIKQRNAIKFATNWYSEEEVYQAIHSRNVQQDDLPTYIMSREFVTWLTKNLRLAMAKGIQIEQDAQKAEIERLQLEIKRLGEVVDERNEEIERLREQVQAGAACQECDVQRAEVERLLGGIQVAVDAFSHARIGRMGLVAEVRAGRDTEIERLEIYGIETESWATMGWQARFEVVRDVLDEQQQEIERLQNDIAELKAKRDSLTGWWVVKDCDDGSLILQSHTGERKHVWQGVEPEYEERVKPPEGILPRLSAQLLASLNIELSDNAQEEKGRAEQSTENTTTEKHHD